MLRVVPLDGLEQAELTDLDEVVERLAAPGEAAGAVPHEPLVVADDRVAEAAVPGLAVLEEAALLVGGADRDRDDGVRTGHEAGPGESKRLVTISRVSTPSGGRTRPKVGLACTLIVAPKPIRLALVDDYEVVLVGLTHMFDAYRDRIEVVDLVIGERVTVDVDVALLDTFAQPEADGGDVATLVANGHAARVAVYTWSFDRQLIESALQQGARGYLSKTLPAAALVDALERIHAGDVVISESPRSRATVGLDWPGRSEGLSDREAEILALVTQAKSNAEIAAVTYLSINTVKSYLRNLYRKIGVRTRTEAALWGVDHGFTVSDHRMDDWA